MSIQKALGVMTLLLMLGTASPVSAFDTTGCEQGPDFVKGDGTTEPTWYCETSPAQAGGAWADSVGTCLAAGLDCTIINNQNAGPNGEFQDATCATYWAALGPAGIKFYCRTAENYNGDGHGQDTTGVFGAVTDTILYVETTTCSIIAVIDGSEGMGTSAADCTMGAVLYVVMYTQGEITAFVADPDGYASDLADAVVAFANEEVVDPTLRTAGEVQAAAEEAYAQAREDAAGCTPSVNDLMPGVICW